MNAEGFGTWLGIALSVAGFGVTWWQLWRTKSAAEAAKAAALAARSRFTQSSLLVLIAEIDRAEDLVKDRLANDDRAALGQALATWRRAAARAGGLLPFAGTAPPGLSLRIAEAAQLAAQAEAALIDGSSLAVPQIVNTAVRELISVGSAINSVLAGLQGYTGYEG